MLLKLFQFRMHFVYEPVNAVTLFMKPSKMSILFNLSVLVLYKNILFRCLGTYIHMYMFILVSTDWASDEACAEILFHVVPIESLVFYGENCLFKMHLSSRMGFFLVVDLGLSRFSTRTGRIVRP